ncbi:MAG: hypothetical protein R2748_07705 [Bryobacterales bacterium]
MLGPARTVVLQVTVTPLDLEDAEPVWMQRAERAGPIPRNSAASVEVSGSFVVGEGRYSVLWQMYDSLGAYCEVKWKIEAKRRRGERDLRLAIEPGEVGESRVYLFRRQKIRPNSEIGKPLDLRIFLEPRPLATSPRPGRGASIRVRSALGGVAGAGPPPASGPDLTRRV